MPVTVVELVSASDSSDDPLTEFASTVSALFAMLTAVTATAAVDVAPGKLMLPYWTDLTADGVELDSDTINLPPQQLNY